MRYARFQFLLTFVLLHLMASAGAEIKWLKTTHDFGAFDEDDGVVSCQMPFVNTGDETLVILATRASCGCTTPSFDKTELAPGDTAILTVSYDPTGLPGRFNKKITVDTNTDPQRTQLNVCGVVLGSAETVAKRYPVDMGPLKFSRSAAILGTAKKMHARAIFVEGYNRSTDTIAPKVVDTPSWLDVTPGPQRVPPGERVSFNFLVRADRTPLYGFVTDTITIVSDSRYPERTYRLPVSITLEEEFANLRAEDYRKAPVAKLETERIQLGEMDFGQKPEAAVKLKNDGKSNLLVRRIYCLNPAVSIDKYPTKIKAGKSANIKFSVTAIPAGLAQSSENSIQGKLSAITAEIVVITNDPINPTQRVVVTTAVR